MDELGTVGVAHSDPDHAEQRRRRASRLERHYRPDDIWHPFSQFKYWYMYDISSDLFSPPWSTPLHHLTTIGATRARALLRAGADLEAAAEAAYGGDGGNTPLSLARALQQAGEAGEDTAAGLVLDAAKPWSQQTHALFPAAARARAVELMLLGHLLSRESVQWGPSFVGAEVSLFDAWMVGVLPQAVQRK